jgi:hypothetical protein
LIALGSISLSSLGAGLGLLIYKSTAEEFNENFQRASLKKMSAQELIKLGENQLKQLNSGARLRRVVVGSILLLLCTSSTTLMLINHESSQASDFIAPLSLGALSAWFYFSTSLEEDEYQAYRELRRAQKKRQATGARPRAHRAQAISDARLAPMMTRESLGLSFVFQF